MKEFKRNAKALTTLMRLKLEVNRSKGVDLTDTSFDVILKGVRDETSELREALRWKSQEEVLFEVADVGNFLLMALALTSSMSKEEYEAWQAEFREGLDNEVPF